MLMEGSGMQFIIRRETILNCWVIPTVTGEALKKTRKALQGGFFSLGYGAVAWSSKKQHINAFSNTEAEYVSLTTAACEAVWLHRLLADINEKQGNPSVIFCDNRSALSIAKNLILHGRTKHIDTHFHFIWDLMKDEQIDVRHCS